jgi:hypothetical protein
MSREDEHVYTVQDEAFRDTPLGDWHDRSSLILEAREIAAECPVLVGPVWVVEGSVHMTSAAATARPGRKTITFAPRAMNRYIAVHEIAHIVHARSGMGGRGHGPQYRGIFVEMTEIVYGERYGILLYEAFLTAGLPVASARLPKTGTPIIDIDKLVESVQEVRWL